MTTPAAAAARFCCVCERTPVPRGTTWCLGCRTGYGMAIRVLRACAPCRPPDPAIIRANIRRYRRRAALSLPLFTGPG